MSAVLLNCNCQKRISFKFIGGHLPLIWSDFFDILIVITFLFIMQETKPQHSTKDVTAIQKYCSWQFAECRKAGKGKSRFTWWHDAKTMIWDHLKCTFLHQKEWACQAECALPYGRCSLVWPQCAWGQQAQAKPQAGLRMVISLQTTCIEPSCDS